MMVTLLEMLGSGSMAGPLLGFAIGVVLGLSPVALPTLPAVVGVLAPGRVDEAGIRRPLSSIQVFPSILAFAFGMNGVLGMVGYVFVSVTVALGPLPHRALCAVGRRPRGDWNQIADP